MENKISSTIETIICINRSENIFLDQALKNHEVFCKINDKNAKGVRSIKIFIIIYLNEYVKTRFNKDMVSVAFIIPSSEKMLSELVFTDIKELTSFINSAKQIFLLNKSSPIPRIARDTKEVKFNICPIMKYELLIQIQKIIHFIKN